MTALVLLFCTGCFAAAPADTTSPDPDRAAFEAARAKVGRDADAYVRLALWCEEHGLSAERMRYLAIAVLTDPSNAMARGLMGLVAYHRFWTVGGAGSWRAT